VFSYNRFNRRLDAFSIFLLMALSSTFCADGDFSVQLDSVEFIQREKCTRSEVKCGFRCLTRIVILGSALYSQNFEDIEPDRNCECDSCELIPELLRRAFLGADQGL
jgi:hypothetical protein